MEEVERWADVVGYEGLYQVSTYGRVKSLERVKWSGSVYYKAPERILKLRKGTNDYLRVALYKDGIGKDYHIHQLVATAFIPNPKGYTEINHVDENPRNNCVQNLEWCDRFYNIHYGTGIKRMAEKHCKPVFGISKISGLIVEYKSAREAGKALNINPSNIIKCCKGKVDSAGNFFWYYSNTTATDNKEHKFIYND